MVRWLLGVFSTSYLLLQVTCFPEEIQNADHRRPIWNIAHMVNSIPQVDYYINQGANSIESDVTFSKNGIAEYVYHGIPCDCFRNCRYSEHIDKFIDYIRQIATPGDPKFRDNFVLMFWDFKLDKLSSSALRTAGTDFAKRLINHYWQQGKSGARAYTLISIPLTKQADFIKTFRETLISEGFAKQEETVGYDFSMNEDLDKIRSTFEQLGIKDRIWQGDGITNCLPRGTGRLKEAVRRRDQGGQTYIDKVYWWTVDKIATIQSVLKIGVDGILNNYPDRVISVLAERDYRDRYRLATIDDNPWVKHVRRMADMKLPPYMQGRGGNFTFEDFQEEEEEILYNC